MASNTTSGSLTEAKIRGFKPEATNRIYWDAGTSAVKGLGVRVTKGGSKAYIIQYRVAGRSRRSTLAQVAAVSLRKAREVAGAQLLAIRTDGDDPLQRRHDAKALPTVADGLDRFFAEFGPGRIADGRMVESTLAKYRVQARRYLYPEIGALKIENVARSDVRAMLSKVKGPVARNRVLALTSRLFTAFEEWEWRSIFTNPARRIVKTREHPRTRVFSASELAAMGAAIAALPCPVHRAALRFLILTGWRTGEVLALEWGMIIFETGVVDLPSTKTGAARRTVDSRVLQSLGDLARTAERVFPAASYRTLRDRLRYGVPSGEHRRWAPARHSTNGCHQRRRCGTKHHSVARSAWAPNAGDGGTICPTIRHGAPGRPTRRRKPHGGAARRRQRRGHRHHRGRRRASETGHRGGVMMTATTGLDFHIRILTALMDEVVSLRPDVPRVEMARAITGRRDFEVRLRAGRVSPRQLEDMEGALCHWLGMEG